mgnify:CR=1 FL=1
MIECPIECVGVGCDKDFVERNGAFLLTIAGVMVGCFGGLLSYFLKSRCSKIKCCGLSLDREVVSLKSEDVEVTTTSNNK